MPQSFAQQTDMLPHNNDALVLQAFYADVTSPNLSLVCFDSQKHQYVDGDAQGVSRSKNGSQVGYASLCGSLLSMNQETQDYLQVYGYTKQSLKRLCRQHCFPEGLDEEIPYHTPEEYQEKLEKDHIKTILKAPLESDITQGMPQNSAANMGDALFIQDDATENVLALPQNPWKKAYPRDRKTTQQQWKKGYTPSS